MVRPRTVTSELPTSTIIAEDLGELFYRSGYPGSGEFRSAYRTIRTTPLALSRCESAHEAIIGLALTTDIWRPMDWAPGAEQLPFGCYLNVGMTRNTSFQNTLELNLLKFLELDGNEAIVWHNGALTAGKGAVAHRETLNRVRELAPQLIRNDRIELWRFDIRNKMTIEVAESLFERVAIYALIRAEVREKAKLARKK